MDIEIFTLCDFAEDMMGKLIIVGTFDTISAPKLPIHLPTCHIAARIRYRSGDSGKAPLELKILDPESHAVIPPIQGELDLQVPPGSDSAVANIAIGIGGLPFKVYGRHSVIFSLRGQEIRTLPLMVVQPKQPNS
jgi:hypothetical protein